MIGGGEYFNPTTRKDKDLYAAIKLWDTSSEV
jgi:hypothetical protein